MRLTLKEIEWLDFHGGRTQDDVFEDIKGKYVMMGNGGGIEIKVYIGQKSNVPLSKYQIEKQKREYRQSDEYLMRRQYAGETLEQVRERINKNKGKRLDKKIKR